ncbi:hypothetical protein AGMMS49965_13260 [Bacteroidia bacterium]|nr:hypothetical protein AGMMS49965_13260 [Bacteroidia bacterium]
MGYELETNCNNRRGGEYTDIHKWNDPYGHHEHHEHGHHEHHLNDDEHRLLRDYKGHYHTVEDIWDKYPHGGEFGWYAIVGHIVPTLYVWSKRMNVWVSTCPREGELEMFASGDEGIASIMGVGYYLPNTSVTFSCVTKRGYTFDGWYDGNTKVSAATTYTFSSGTQRKYLIAKTVKTPYTFKFTDATGTHTQTPVYYTDYVQYDAAEPVGQYFDHWDSQNIILKDPYAKKGAFCMPDRNVEINAVFKYYDYKITTKSVPSASGSISGAPDTAHYGDATSTFSITATPNRGWRFVNWSSTGGTIANVNNATTNFSMPAHDVEITANFVQIDYTYTITNGDGTFTDEHKHYGDVVAYNAGTPPIGKVFDHWTVSGVTMDTTKANGTFVMPDNAVTLVAVFKWADYSFTVVGGTGSQPAVHYGDTVNYAANIPVGYEFVRWISSDIYPPENASGSLSMPAKNVTITAEIRMIDYSLTVIGGTGSGIKHYGDNVYVDATVPIGKRFDSWTTTGISPEPHTQHREFSMPANDVEMEAHFDWIYHNISKVSNPTDGGTFNISAETAHYSEQVELIPFPATGYKLISFSTTGGTISYNETDGYFLTMPNSDVTVTANFEKIKYGIDKEIDPANGGSFSAPATATYGEQVTLTPTPATGYYFSHFSTTGGTLDGNTLTMPASDVTVTAHFDWIYHNISKVSNPADGGTFNISAETAHYSEQVELIPLPATGYKLISFSTTGGTISYNETDGYFLTMPNSDVTITANFETQHAITKESDPEDGGTFDAPEKAFYGEQVQLTPIPADGYVFISWETTGGTISDNILSMPDSDVTVTAKFSMGHKNIIKVVNPEFGGTILAQEKAHYGDIVPILAIPAIGYRFTSWDTTGGIIEEPYNESAELVMPDDNVTITANFEQKNYFVRVNNGTGSTQYAHYQDIIPFAATPPQWFEWFSWQTNTSLVNPSTESGTFEMPARNVVLTPRFLKTRNDAFLLTMINMDGSEVVHSYLVGDTVNYFLNEMEGHTFFQYEVEGITLDDITQPNGTFTMPNNDVVLVTNGGIDAIIRADEPCIIEIPEVEANIYTVIDFLATNGTDVERGKIVIVNDGNKSVVVITGSSGYIGLEVSESLVNVNSIELTNATDKDIAFDYDVEIALGDGDADETQIEITPGTADTITLPELPAAGETLVIPYAASRGENSEGGNINVENDGTNITVYSTNVVKNNGGLGITIGETLALGAVVINVDNSDAEDLLFIYNTIVPPTPVPPLPTPTVIIIPATTSVDVSIPESLLQTDTNVNYSMVRGDHSESGTIKIFNNAGSSQVQFVNVLENNGNAGVSVTGTLMGDKITLTADGSDADDTIFSYTVELVPATHPTPTVKIIPAGTSKQISVPEVDTYVGVNINYDATRGGRTESGTIKIVNSGGRNEVAFVDMTGDVGVIVRGYLTGDAINLIADSSDTDDVIFSYWIASAQ